MSHGAAALGAQLPWAIGTLAACSLAKCGLQTADVDPPRVELPSAGPGAYRLAAPGAITCLFRLLQTFLHETRVTTAASARFLTVIEFRIFYDISLL